MDLNNLSPNATILGDQFYAEYRGAGLSPGLVLMAVLIACCAIPGNCMNLFLVYVTAKHKSLRGSSNYLIGLNSLYEFLHQTGHYIFLYTILSGRNFVPLLDSALLQVQSVFGYNAAIFTMVETAVDRLICILFPHFHNRLHLPLYLGVYTVASWLPGAYLAALVMEYAIRHPTEPVTGQLSDTCTPVNLIYNYNMVVCVATLVLYSVIGLIVLWKSQSSQNARLFRSLAAICGLLVGLYFFNTVLRMLIVDRVGPVQLWYANVAGGVLVNIAAAANLPILYAFSTEYRKIVRTELAGLFRTNQVVPTSSQNLFIMQRQNQQQFGKNNSSLPTNINS